MNTHNKIKLFFLEAMFPSIALKNGVLYDTPVEFREICWKKYLT